MTQDEMKQQVAEAALEYVEPNTIIGVGTGSTANMFIDALATMKEPVKGAVASSEASAERLQSHGIPLLNLNDALSQTGALSVYVDGADEFDSSKYLTKGGGGALTREKIVAAASRQFVCIVDESKRVEALGAFPLPVEVIPMARELVALEVRKLGGEPRLREGYLTDNGNEILDVHGLSVTDPMAMEEHLNQTPGVVTNGIFALQGADIVLMATPNGVERIQ